MNRHPVGFLHCHLWGPAFCGRAKYETILHASGVAPAIRTFPLRGAIKGPQDSPAPARPHGGRTKRA
ncbi:protein of unknown function [Cupriavidus taiwanensis]|uniref:Uncharacterized protein n=1 Tax=Cupriavidus taiwanensis TaxID=164546 RepID=A0A9Q7UPX7_9BURK|nr:protein of unknown function [Cupriavidus taiwanensis]